MMRNFINIIEAHHDFGVPTFDTEYQPMHLGDTVKVFHGFRDFPHAVELAKHGLSGKVRAARVYSYESDNNPYGLFVTISQKIASEFIGAYGVQAMVEFNAPVADLEAPVWPGGSYTVQGEYSQYFGHGAKGRAARKERTRTAGQEIEGEIGDKPHIAGSDNKLLAYMLTNSREHQALFIGHLDPSGIAAWHVRPAGSNTTVPFERISPQEFLERYSDTKLSQDSRAEDKLFLPNETFDGDAFINRLRARFGNRRDDDFFVQFIRNAWENIIANKSDRMGMFREYFNLYLWPKQYVPCLQWMRREFGSTKGLDS